MFFAVDKKSLITREIASVRRKIVDASISLPRASCFYTLDTLLSVFQITLLLDFNIRGRDYIIYI